MTPQDLRDLLEAASRHAPNVAIPGMASVVDDLTAESILRDCDLHESADLEAVMVAHMQAQMPNLDLTPGSVLRELIRASAIAGHSQHQAMEMLRGRLTLPVAALQVPVPTVEETLRALWQHPDLLKQFALALPQTAGPLTEHRGAAGEIFLMRQNWSGEIAGIIDSPTPQGLWYWRTFHVVDGSRKVDEEGKSTVREGAVDQMDTALRRAGWRLL